MQSTEQSSDSLQPLRLMWYIYTMDFYSHIKKNDIMEFARKWVEPEIIILSERSQTSYIMYFSQTEYKIKGKLQGRQRVVWGGGGEETIIREKKHKYYIFSHMYI